MSDEHAWKDEHYSCSSCNERIVLPERFSISGPDGFTYEESLPRRFNLKFIWINIIVRNFLKLTILVCLSYFSGIFQYSFGTSGRTPLEGITFVIFAFLCVYFAPFIFRTYDITNKIRRIEPDRYPGEIFCQFTAYPRRNSFFRRFMDDADDLGMLSIDDEGLSFQGDHTSFFLPKSMIEEIEYYSEIPRSLGMSKRTRIMISPEAEPFFVFEFGELETCTITSLLKNPKKIHEKIRKLSAPYGFIPYDEDDDEEHMRAP